MTAIFDGRLLTFSVVDEAHMQDAETGTTWDGLSGQAVEGELAGSSLQRVKSTSSFWFGWKDWFPETAVYGADAQGSN